MLGQGGSDSVHGGPIPQPAPGASDATIDDDDALSGGAGVDTVSGDFGSDVMFGDDEAAGFMVADGSMRRVSDAKPNLSTWRGWCDTAATGDGDLMVGNAGNDIMHGGGGADQMDGDEGNDWACGVDGADQVVGDFGDDELRGNTENDTLTGNDGHDVIFGGFGDDVANGNAGGDDIFGDGGSDVLIGEDGDDIVVGDTGSVAGGHQHGVADGSSVSVAKVLAMNTAVTRNSSTGGTTLRSCDPAGAPVGDADCILGGGGSDALFGGSDADLIQGQAGVDLVEGNDGADNIHGGTKDSTCSSAAWRRDLRRRRRRRHVRRSLHCGLEHGYAGGCGHRPDVRRPRRRSHGGGRGERRVRWCRSGPHGGQRRPGRHVRRHR